MKATAFLEYVGEHYEELKKKWSERLKKQGYQFNEDIFQDTILKVHSNIITDEDFNGDIEGYFYKAFIQNTKRDLKYSYHKRDDTIDVSKYMDEIPNDDPLILLEEIEDKVKDLDDIEKHLFLIYYMTEITYKDLEDLTGIKGMRYRIKKITDKIKGTKKKKGVLND